MNAGSLKPMNPTTPAVIDDRHEKARQKMLASAVAMVQFLASHDAHHLDSSIAVRKRWQKCISEAQSTLDRFILFEAQTEKGEK
jgi:hypothetical protein